MSKRQGDSYRRPKDEWYHNILRFPSKEELEQRYQELILRAKEKANAQRLREDERCLHKEGDE